ncbi:hypothetical protein Q31b_45180 [Novipirellula aureliae]|uniref:Acyl-coenzyme A thioesterase THEM4 n=1 Tax=Novipirellula aureliae TaxID=2527966 RepID=A0A5C6DSL4_9BACT|nr:PaaI family thioesterase [Novipirellula aureliae]TWU37729.1 hypothetical protein Q31b_45180 [Novipirellula aureliae]
MRTSKHIQPKDSRTYQERRLQEHPNCFACGANQPNDDGRCSGLGLGLRFELVGNGIVEATFACQQHFEGYPNMLHGGIACMLLDAAMTNCLFANQITAVTGDMNVRFRKPIVIETTAVIRAWIESPQAPLYKVAAELRQDNRIKASAHARFVERNTADQIVQDHPWQQN